MHSEHEYLKEGIISINSSKKLYGIRIFKRRMSLLKSTCAKLVTLISEKVDSKKSTLTFKSIRLFASDGEADLIEQGLVYASAGTKIREAIKHKAIEFYGGIIFLGLAVLITLMSNHTRDAQNDFIVNSWPDKFWVNYFERLIPPFLVSGGLLLYQFINYQRTVFKRPSVIIWQQN
jgi:hypothetical protein